MTGGGDKEGEAMTTDWEVLDVYGLYRDGWKNEITAESFSHPAKFARGLIRWIYEFLFARGLLAEGMTVIDPFAGVALGGLDAMRYGLHWTGCELEEKFVALGQANIDLWNARYAGRFARWGTARILQGDSRRLAEVLVGAGFGGAVTSPPFGDAGSVLNVEGHIRQVTAERAARKSEQVYGSHPAQLGNLPARDGDLDSVLSSPPYVSGGHHPDQTGAWGGKAQSVPKDLAGYGKSDGQIGQMQEGDFDAALTSPPFLQTSGGTNVTSESGPLSDPSLIARHAAGNAAAQGYGESESNLGNMAEGSVDGAILSPPYAGSLETAGGIDAQKSRHIGGPNSQMNQDDTRYGSSPAQLAALPEGRPPEQADAALTSPPFTGSTSEDRADRANTYWNFKTGHHKHEKANDAYGERRGSLYNQFAYMSPEWVKERRRQSETQNLSRLPEEAETVQTFWSASRTILEQTFALLRPHIPGRPGGCAVFVCKDYVRGGQRVPFSDNWRRLAESVGFVTIIEVRAWVTEDNGTQLAMDGKHKQYKTERKSFFRRLAEKKGSPRIDHETVWIMAKPLPAPEAMP